MPAEVKILLEGYTNADYFAENGEERNQPTISLVRDGDFVIVVDPGVLESQQLLIEALEKENLTVSDVNVVFITHSHIDHYRNIGMFPKAKTLEFFGLWDKNSVEKWTENFTSNIKVIFTPGHDYTGITLLATTADGVVAICGDVFWKENFPVEPKDDAYASDIDKLKQSREMILGVADWVIPGHGKMYKNYKGMVPVKNIEEDEKQKNFGICRKCHKIMKTKRDSCKCRQYLCHHCCECGLDCNNCSCSHKKDA